VRFAWVVIGVALAACPGARSQVAPSPRPALPRLLPPPPLVDLETPDTVYRTALALQLQPSWAQFLDDCRLRLPAGHPLNVMSLVATAEIAVDATGTVVDVRLQSSGNADYDRAVRQVIEDAAPLPRPPRALWADDDLVHVRWLFARDRRQAGPATARIESHDLPVREVTTRLVEAGDLSRAAQRIRREPPSADRDAATYALMTAALREAVVDSTDGTVRRSAIESIGRCGVRELAPIVRDLLTTTSDVEVRIAALAASARLADRATVAIALDHFRTDLFDDRRLALAQAEMLTALHAEAEVATVLRDHLARAAAPEPTALAALAIAPVPELTPRIVGWTRSADSRVREAACTALFAVPTSEAAKALTRGLGDRDAGVRASCLDTVRRRARDGELHGLAPLVRKLAADRDTGVRATAIAALAELDPAALKGHADDPAPEVRAAYTAALARASSMAPLDIDVEATLAVMLDDQDAGVRAAAWTAWLSLPPGPTSHAARATRALRAATDPSPLVRAASLAGLDDDAVLARLATLDDNTAVRMSAMVALAGRRGRSGIGDLVLTRLAEAVPASAERVRTATAWLLAR
jgi:TonB family protein